MSQLRLLAVLGCTGIRPARGVLPAIRGTAALPNAATPAEVTCENIYQLTGYWLHNNRATTQL
eukprot:4693277-Amphidinium_carterae.1